MTSQNPIPNKPTRTIDDPYQHHLWPSFFEWANEVGLDLNPNEKDWWMPWFNCYVDGACAGVRHEYSKSAL